MVKVLRCLRACGAALLLAAALLLIGFVSNPPDVAPKSVDVEVKEDVVEVAVAGELKTAVGVALLTVVQVTQAECAVEVQCPDVAQNSTLEPDSFAVAKGPVEMRGRQVRATLAVSAGSWPCVIEGAGAWSIESSSCKLGLMLFGIVPIPWQATVPMDRVESALAADDNETDAEASNSSEPSVIKRRFYGELNHTLGVEVCMTGYGTSLMRKLGGKLEHISLKLPESGFQMSMPRTQGEWLVSTSSADLPNLMDGGCILNASTVFDGMMDSPLVSAAVDSYHSGSPELGFAPGGNSGLWGNLMASGLESVKRTGRRRLTEMQGVDLAADFQSENYAGRGFWVDMWHAIRYDNGFYASVLALRDHLDQVGEHSATMQMMALELGGYLLDQLAVGFLHVPREPISSNELRWHTSGWVDDMLPSYPGATGTAYTGRPGLEDLRVVITAGPDAPNTDNDFPSDDWMQFLFQLDYTVDLHLSSHIVEWLRIHEPLQMAPADFVLNGSATNGSWGEVHLQGVVKTTFTETPTGGTITGTAGVVAKAASGDITILSASQSGTQVQYECTVTEAGPYQNGTIIVQLLTGEMSVTLRGAPELTVQLESLLDYVPVFTERLYARTTYFDYNTNVTVIDAVGRTTVTAETPQFDPRLYSGLECEVVNRESDGEVRVDTAQDLKLLMPENLLDASGYTLTVNRPPPPIATSATTTGPSDASSGFLAAPSLVLWLLLLVAFLAKDESCSLL